jgi:hypothetical protein
MATESVSASEFNELASRYEALERQANSLLAAMSRGRSIRNFLMLALLVLVGALCWTLYSMGNRLRSEKFMLELSNLATERMEKNGPAVQKHLVTLYEKSSPILTAAFQKRAEEDQPKYVAAAEKEWPEFKKSFETKLEERFRDQYKLIVADCKPELEKACPELKTNPDKYRKVEEGLVGAAERVVDKLWKQRVEPPFTKLEANWASYPEAPKAKDDEPSIGMQIVGHGFELLAIVFARGEGLAAFVDMPEKKPLVRPVGPGKEATKSDANAKKGG